MWIEGLGLMAATLTTLAFVPQVAQVWRTRSTEGISLSMYTLFTLGIAMWFVYGLMLKSVPIIAANGVTFVLAVTVLIMKVRYGKPGLKETSPEPTRPLTPKHTGL